MKESPKITGKAQVTVEPKTFTMVLGDFSEATATIRNLGQTIEQFLIGIEGLNPDWYDLTVSSVALFPNDEEVIKLLIHLTICNCNFLSFRYILHFKIAKDYKVIPLLIFNNPK